MIDTKDFTFFESQHDFDFKGFTYKLTGYWKWIVLTLLVALFIAYQVNIRKEKIYELSTLISVQDENNPFFTSNTSLVFNWGGVSDKIQNIITSLKSRTHNEDVINKLDLYLTYFEKKPYYYKDIYGNSPFVVEIDKSKLQINDLLIKIVFKNQSTYEVTLDFEKDSYKTERYFDNFKADYKPEKSTQTQIGTLGKPINLPFLNITLMPNPKQAIEIGKSYYIKFDDFNETVIKYQEINVETIEKESSIIKLSIQGTNKKKIVDFLNKTTNLLIIKQLQSKNEYADNTIAFIDSTLYKMESELDSAEKELKTFRQKSDVIELESGSKRLYEKLSAYDIQKEVVSQKLNYYTNLQRYLQSSVDFSKLPAPSVVGIDDANIVGGVAQLIQLSKERSDKEFTTKNKSVFTAIDSKIESIKKVLLENISNSKAVLNSELSINNQKIKQAENTLSRMPEQQINLLNITRKYSLKDNIYTTFLQKRSEAEVVRAANLSDISVIDPAKDVGRGIVGPRTSINYILALLLGILVPVMIFSIKILFDNTINNSEDIVKLTQIPLLGVIGKKTTESNLSVFEKPKSALSESFRAIRSSLQYMYKKQQVEGAKTVMLTSSISGEGKTFCSLNLATVFALSKKKTVIVGLDLRKPRIFGDFNVNNTTGVVNYLIGQKSLNEIIQKTHIPYLDIITSGPIPPNPSELLMSSAMKELINELKQQYDFIVLDTPPIGLVSDALELSEYCDATLYIVRQAYTEKGMLQVINEKHSKGELHNISIILNGFENKAKYGYGYGYGYGNYNKEYLDGDTPKTSFITKVKQPFLNIFNWLSKR